MNSHGLEVDPGTHLRCVYRGSAQRDELLGPYVAEGIQAGHTCFVAVSDREPDRIQAFNSGFWPGQLIVRPAGGQEFTKDNFDIELGTGVVFEAMKVHPRIWLSGLVLENPLNERTA